MTATIASPLPAAACTVFPASFLYLAPILPAVPPRVVASRQERLDLHEHLDAPVVAPAHLHISNSTLHLHHSSFNLPAHTLSSAFKAVSRSWFLPSTTYTHHRTAGITPSCPSNKSWSLLVHFTYIPLASLVFIKAKYQHRLLGWVTKKYSTLQPWASVSSKKHSD